MVKNVAWPDLRNSVCGGSRSSEGMPPEPEKKIIVTHNLEGTPMSESSESSFITSGKHTWYTAQILISIVEDDE